MSAALFLSEHRGTQFGEVYPVADRFESMLDGDIKLDDFVKEVDEKLDANKTFLDLMLERNAVGKTRIGTVYVFPKNFQFHRGLARGPNPKEPRLVLYFTFVRASRPAEYEVDKMETAEITVGFANGKFGLAGAWMWVTQFYVALEVPLLQSEALLRETFLIYMLDRQIYTHKNTHTHTHTHTTNFSRKKK